MNHVEKAEKFFSEGCNCSQAVFAAFDDITGIKHEDALKISSPFGGGIGGSGLICGALSGMLMAYGSICGGRVSRSDNYKTTRAMTDEFIKENGTHICSELRRLRRDSGGKSCAELVKSAAYILDKQLNN